MRAMNQKPALELLRRILTELVAHPENLRIEYRALTASLTIMIQADTGDTPRLIGEQAQNYRALCAIMAAVGAAAGYRVAIPPIQEPVIGAPSRYRFEPNPDWPKERILKLLRDVAEAVFAHSGGMECMEFDDPANGITTVEVHVSRLENPKVVDVLRPAIGRMFDAIGKANGHLLAVDIIQSADPGQPDSADGRFTKQLKRQ